MVIGRMDDGGEWVEMNDRRNGRNRSRSLYGVAVWRGGDFVTAEGQSLRPFGPPPFTVRVMEREKLSFAFPYANNENASLGWLAVPCIAVIE